jgi:hypothetical protein
VSATAASCKTERQLQQSLALPAGSQPVHWQIFIPGANLLPPHFSLRVQTSTAFLTLTGGLAAAEIPPSPAKRDADPRQQNILEDMAQETEENEAAMIELLTNDREALGRLYALLASSDQDTPNTDAQAGRAQADLLAGLRARLRDPQASGDRSGAPSAKRRRTGSLATDRGASCRGVALRAERAMEEGPTGFSRVGI